MRFVPEPGSFSLLYVTRTNGYTPADVNNPCVQATATLCCVWDLMARYYTPGLGSNLSCSAALTAQQFFDSLGAQSLVAMDLPSLGIRSYYASAQDEADGLVTVELAQGAATSLSQSVNRFGIGLLVVQPNPSTSPEAIIDFTVFDVFSVNNFLLSVRTSQDYTVLSAIQASLHQVYYPVAGPNSTAMGAMYYANINFVVPQAYRMLDTPGNIVAYLGTQQLPFSQAAAWQSPCGVYGPDPNARLGPTCKLSSTLNFCHPVQHDFLARPGIDINLQIPFEPDLSVPGLFLYASVLVQLQDSTGVRPPVFTNVVLSVPLTGFIQHCAPVLSAARGDRRTGLEAGSSITQDINQLTHSLGIDSAPLATYSIDLTGSSLISSITDALITVKLEGYPSYFTANPTLQIYVDQVLTIHTLSNATRAKVKYLIDNYAAYYTVPPSPGGSYTQLVLRQALLDLCQEGAPSNTSDCLYRWEVQDRITVDPFFAHRVSGTSQDTTWLANVIGTSDLASQVAINVSQYQGIPGGADPRYNSVVWLYPAYAWPGKSMFYLSDYVFAAVAFSVQAVGQPVGNRRLLSLDEREREEGRLKWEERRRQREAREKIKTWHGQNVNEEDARREAKAAEGKGPRRVRSQRRPHLHVIEKVVEEY
ncbi:hypothetical protein GUITHDRAFT_149318 [Guillardia theta CCMP2712]|uniref:Uncharacterized protein n=1 Tax=Guillardia theta (strain CCMP2712) TaxID=905079 RepID=L1I6C1_GUITC|nr:hypothetical protein GUITHDRAFT_149318 [Guillardia theta CCMP2712]EKX31410.1 hypothetical protein GUITHDRAFT_149318 [Guillardia theta CCMP2712]|eukprot:XP_005818390.1 hypothetical protein GUITHDRAFT_149318 [Guillardia theta CCMP2712]